MEGKLRNMCAIYISRGKEMLLLYRIGSRVVEPSFCGIGGHFEEDELNDARACILREMQEEIGLEEDDLLELHMRYVTLRLKHGEIRQNYYFFANIKESCSNIESCNEGVLSWTPYEEVLQKEMPYSAKCMLEHYMEIGCHTNYLYGGVTEKSGIDFKLIEEF